LTIDGNGLLQAGLSFDGSTQVNAKGALEIEIAGTQPGVDYDVLLVTGNVTVGGNLNVKFLDGFAPKIGDSFAFLRAGKKLIGQFNTINIAGLASGFAYQIVTNSSGGMLLVATSAGVATTAPRLAVARASAGGLLLAWPIRSPPFILEMLDPISGGTLAAGQCIGHPQW